uniref:Uncharacterized protein n=1 Tax=Human herpesvirus 2 TaxID=10310 RepID=A0A481TSP0_HHV2|nr:hypothetical protein [Human alphaherpesvirus 2]
MRNSLFFFLCLLLFIETDIRGKGPETETVGPAVAFF